jgi:hypothetical protein
LLDTITGMKSRCSWIGSVNRKLLSILWELSLIQKSVR